MKKFLSIISISLLCMTAAAQVTNPVVQMTRRTVCAGCSGTQADTATNTGTAFDTIVLKQSYACGSIEIDVTKISGTLAGILKLQVCNRFGDVAAPQWTTINDTATVTNTSGTKAYFFQLPGVVRSDNTATLQYPVAPYLPFYAYRILWTGTGTMSGSMKSYFVGRKLN